jgi:hypothetical protein
MLRRALLSDQTVDGVNLGIHRATQLLRTYTAQVEALTRSPLVGVRTQANAVLQLLQSR